VFDWWRRLFPRKTTHGGAPRTGREKTYSADSGYVYQYVLSSFRQYRRGGEDCHEYVFQVRGGRSGATDIAVILKSSVLQQWEREHDREFSASERYGIAKITLKRQLDASEDPVSVPPAVSPDIAQVTEITTFLGL
jgi:hypothetical protein